jgi:hypothetical protein
MRDLTGSIKKLFSLTLSKFFSLVERSNHYLRSAISAIIKFSGRLLSGKDDTFNKLSGSDDQKILFYGDFSEAKKLKVSSKLDDTFNICNLGWMTLLTKFA